jgi:hypothetical protein
MSAAIVRLKVTLNDAEPKVLHRVEVLADIKLDWLHLPLQVALGWTNSHLYEIRAKDLRFGLPNPDWAGRLLDARKARPTDVLEDAGTKDTVPSPCTSWGGHLVVFDNREARR